jgi:hypothetical protein
MSVYALKLSFLQTCPKVWVENNHLYARTSKLYRIFNTFFYSRTVIVDPSKRVIEIIIKTFWCIKSRESIPFDDLKYIDLSLREYESDYGMTPNGFGARDATEIYYVQVKTKSKSVPVNLFRFIGDGGRYTGWSGVLLGDDVIDCEGQQHVKALRYAEQVSKFTGIPLWQDRKVEFSFNLEQQYKCPRCGHTNNTTIKKCIYCGFHEENKGKQD